MDGKYLSLATLPPVCTSCSLRAISIVLRFIILAITHLFHVLSTIHDSSLLTGCSLLRPFYLGLKHAITRYVRWIIHTQRDSWQAGGACCAIHRGREAGAFLHLTYVIPLCSYGLKWQGI